MVRSGSSPRTWGTRCVGASVHQHARFIPTHVGNAFPEPGSISSMPVHPHARGERQCSVAGLGAWSGSSPRTWGTPGRPSLCCRPARFIPTHVGNAVSRQGVRGPVAVHPHARGERSIARPSAWIRCGSSPRTWGTLSDADAATAQWRFIPTHVGNAQDAAIIRRSRSVHPHARGERQPSRRAFGIQDGSSPRTWGTRTNCTPGHSISPVHPHARGER